MCELRHRKHFKSICDSGLVKFCVLAILKEKQDSTGVVDYNTEHYHERGVYHSHSPPQCKHSTSLSSTNTPIHNKATTPTIIYPLTERNIHLNKQFNITLIIMSLTGSYFSQQVKNVSRATYFQISNSVSIIRRGGHHPNQMLQQ